MWPLEPELEPDPVAPDEPLELDPVEPDDPLAAVELPLLDPVVEVLPVEAVAPEELALELLLELELPEVPNDEPEPVLEPTASTCAVQPLASASSAQIAVRALDIGNSGCALAPPD